VGLVYQSRNYSFFSSRGNGARYFTGNGKPVNGGGERVPESKTTGKVQQVEGQKPREIVAETTTEKTSREPDIRPSVTMPPPPPHPILTARDLQIHQFFSLHRPLLTLYSPSPFLIPSTVFSTKTSVQQAAPWEEDSDAEEDAQSDGTALALWHSLINSKLKSSIDFHSVLANLGSQESRDMKQAVENEVLKVRISMDSTQRKRRKKMSKHKLKKRRRLERALRRQQSK